MRTAILYDSEFLSVDGAMRRFWCGPFDPEPTVVQIGAVRLGLDGDFPLLETFQAYVSPKDREGKPVPIDPFLSELTGITQAQVDAEGQPLVEALTALDAFSQGAPFWSWGRDDHFMVAISCFVEGIPPVIPATRFGNATRLFLQAGMPYEAIQKTSSSGLAAYFGLNTDGLSAHDALSDARSMALAVQHLLRRGDLPAEALLLG
ncbi:3'-5' exonuclease [Flavimaricola marinus]|uniref:Exonuclease n=1 Tax=Flavimaricola marinus TaxID=1819565 RepID=A0A238L8L9_9RHOB|nr:3'-5' exonuclease [Flavimaricola marinus]SMY05942.1 Exonuclease [Flavimaricola marinus]